MSGLIKVTNTRPLLLVLLFFYFIFITSTSYVFAKETSNKPGEGMLFAKSSDGAILGPCTLEKTDVKAMVSGFVASVTVNQVFTNPYSNSKIDAVYTFPLSNRGAIDEMHIQIGKRVILAEIQTREKASKIYEKARKQGKTAALLDEERPNIFTQHVANIEPGAKIIVSIHYSELLKFEKGEYEFVFPTTVGPRFIPGKSVGRSGSGSSADTTSVADASKITPPIATSKMRVGNISFALTIDAGFNLSLIESKLHKMRLQKLSDKKFKIELKKSREIPNRDIVVNWRVSGEKIKTGILTHRGKIGANQEGFFTAMLVPPARVEPKDIAPKELIFVVDSSGSQAGEPIEKAKETMHYIVDRMNANDTFQIIAFNNETYSLFDKPQKNSDSTRRKAHEYISSLEGNGGTFMAEVVRAACAVPAEENRLRIVTFMTDGYVGNDYEIVGLVKSLRGNSRWFSFGTGNSVNRFLLDKIAKEGGGEADYILLSSPAEEIARNFFEKIKSPVLTDVKLSFQGLKVDSVLPGKVCDVWSNKPVYFTGRYHIPSKGEIVITGKTGNKSYRKVLKVVLPDINESNSSLASVWSRAQVDELLAQDYLATQNRSPKKELKDKIVNLGLKYNLLTPYTSFVAVDSRVGSSNQSKQVVIPVNIPDGVIGYEESGPGLIGAPVDPRYGQSNEVGQLADYGYDTACANVVALTVLIFILALVSVIILNVRRRLSIRTRIISVVCVLLVPYLVLSIGMMLVNNMSMMSGGL